MKEDLSILKKLSAVIEFILTIAAFFNLLFLFFSSNLETMLPSRWGLKYNDIIVLVLTCNLFLKLVRTKFKLSSIRIVIIDVVVLITYPFYRSLIKIFWFYLVGRQVFNLLKRITSEQNQSKIYKKISDNPAIVFLLSFVLVIMFGTVFLMLPSATANQGNTSFIDALFTSTSATCVTGLIVHDTGSHFTFLGQIIILGLIQIGGLGIMTISTAFAIILGQKLTLRSENIMQDVVGESNKVQMFQLIKNIFFVTVVFEMIGAIPLYFVFDHDLFSAVFHSISAFCNAGFSLYSNSFENFYGNWILNLTVMLLIIFGGIGFTVISDLKRIISSKKLGFKRLSLHSKIAIITTFILIAIGFILYFISEFNYTMEHFSFKDRFLSSLFQSVTTRTAGFNTIDNSNLSYPSVFITWILMFIGASPGSTGGGIKTTTLAVIVLSIVSIIKGRTDVIAYNKKIPEITTRKVMALIAVSLLVLFLMIFLLLEFGLDNNSAGQENFGKFQEIVFEAFSAFGTVGLSMGITSNLSIIGKIIIIILMYLGRVGPLTFIFALSAQKSVSRAFSFSEERITVG